MTKPTEWQCDCGAWVPIGYSRHTHLISSTPDNGLEQMIAVHAAEEAGLVHNVDVLAETPQLEYVWRGSQHKVR